MRIRTCCFYGSWTQFWRHFEVLRHHFGTILVIIGCQGALRRALECPNIDFHRFSMILGRPVGTTLGSLLHNFCNFKSVFGLQARILMVFDWKSNRFLMPQPFRNTVKTYVFIRFHFSSFLLIWVTSETYLDLVLFTLDGLGAPILWFVRLLYRHCNFDEFLGSFLAPKNKIMWSLER